MSSFSRRLLVGLFIRLDGSAIHVTKPRGSVPSLSWIPGTKVSPTVLVSPALSRSSLVRFLVSESRALLPRVGVIAVPSMVGAAALLLAAGWWLVLSDLDLLLRCPPLRLSLLVLPNRTLP